MYDRAQELMLFKKWKSGDREARELLVESQWALANKLAFKARCRYDWTDHDESESAAIEGVRIAIEKFDPERGYRLSTVAFTYIRGCLHRAATKLHRRNYEIDWDVAGTQHDEVGIEERRQLIQSALDQLQSREAEIVRRHIMGEETLQQIGRSLGISRQAATKIERKALSKLRLLLSELI